MSRRYAEDTRVPVAQSQAELKAQLVKAGATETAVYEGPERSSVMFVLGNRHYRITMRAPAGPTPAKRAQDERRGWRLLVLLVKSKLEGVREGVSTMEREFMGDMVMPNGQTMAEYAGPMIADAYATGRMPTSLLLEGPR